LGAVVGEIDVKVKVKGKVKVKVNGLLPYVRGRALGARVGGRGVCRAGGARGGVGRRGRDR
jgi:hypothetical protein